MQELKLYIQNLKTSQLTLVSVVLCFPAFLLNLDAIAFIGDEAIRTLVAMEMKLSGNFIVPTLNGEAYFNKPPLFNWFIILISELFGYFGEWPSRITSLIFLGAFGWTVYYFVRKYFDGLTAMTMALMLLTSGRILFWDSMLGLIDICFSWIIYLNFMLLYTLAKAQRWRLLFISSYLLFSVAFLLKGLPAVVFQGISILVALQLHGVLKRKVFSMEHFLGIAIGVIPVILYYATYASQVSIDQVFSILLDQSLQRTVTHHTLWDTFKHIFTFPLEQSYHFLPWSLLIIPFFHPKCRAWIRQNDFIRFQFWMLISNIPVYWISVQVFPRYLLMFVPLFNMVGFYLLQQSLDTTKNWWRVFHYIFVSLTGLALVIIALMPINAQVQSLSGMPWIWIGGSLLIFVCLLCIASDVKRTFLWFAITLLVVRSIFNLVILPIRSIDYRENITRESCSRVAALYGDQTWYVFGQSQTWEVARFYTSAYADQMILRTQEANDTTAYYLVDRNLHPDFPGFPVDSFILERGQKLFLMRVQP